MTAFLVRRVLSTIWVILGATMLVFFMIRLVPGDAAELIAMARQGGLEQVSQKEIESVRTKEFLDAPLFVQYGKWLRHVVRGDLGRSLVTGRCVASEIWSRFPASFQLAAAGMLVALILAIPAGAVSAAKPDTIWDHFCMSGALLGVSMPNFWLGVLLILFFSIHLEWLPVFGKGSLAHFILPALTLGTGMAALSARLTRASLLEVLSCNYIRTAKAKGLSRKAIIGKHALKNALVPIVTIIGLQFAYVLEGSVIVETIFAWPGIGRLLVQAIFSRDFTMIQGCALFIAVLFSVANLIVDICCSWLDPRIRYERRIT